MKRTNKNNQGFGMVPILIAVVVVALVGFLAYAAYRNMNPAKSTSDSSKTTPVADSPKTQDMDDMKDMDQMGMITGKTSYPSEGLPADEEVCAEHTDGSGSPVCLNVGKDQARTFTLSLRPGEYYIYATAEEEMPNYKAYYNEYVKCMDIVDGTCGPDTHNDKIVVKVEAGKTVSDVEPGDWYANTVVN